MDEREALKRQIERLQSKSFFVFIVKWIFLKRRVLEQFWDLVAAEFSRV